MRYQAKLAISLIAVLTPAVAGGNVSATTGTADQCDEPVTLRFLRWEGDTLQIAVDDFEASQECIDIEVEEVPFGQLAQTISVMAASGNLPDLFLFDGPYTQDYASQGILLPFDDYISAEHLADINDATLQEHTYEGQLYSPGIEQSAMALYYNKEMTDAAGITPPQTLEDAWTWEEAREAFQAIKDQEIAEWALAPSFLGDGTPGYPYRDLVFARSMGDPDAPEGSSARNTFDAIAPDGSTVEGYIDTPEAIEGLEFYQSLFDDELTPKVGIPNAFIDGTAAFDIDPPFMASSLDAADAFEWGVTPLPYFNTPITHTGSGTLGVSANTEHPDEAMEFALFATNPEESLKYSDHHHALPVRNSVLAEQDLFDSYPMSIFRDELTEWGVPRPSTPAFGQYDQIVYSALRDIALGADPQNSMTQAAATLQPFLEQT